MRALLFLGMCAVLAGCGIFPELRTASVEQAAVSPEQLTVSFAGTCNRIGLMAGTPGFDKCMAGQWEAHNAERAADQNRRAAVAAAFLRSGAFAPTPAPPAYQIPVQPAPAILPPINCTTTAGPNTGPFGVVTSNTTCR